MHFFDVSNVLTNVDTLVISKDVSTYKKTAAADVTLEYGRNL